MKKILTVFALASATTLAVSAKDFTYEATPEPGIVTELSTIEVVFPEFDDIDIDSQDDITVNRDGENIPVSVKDAAGDGNSIIVTFPNREVTPGKYTLNIGQWAIMGYYGGYKGMEGNPSDIKLEYTIEGSGSDLFGFTVAPATGTVTELSTVTFTFPSLAEVEIVSSDDLTATLNGNPVELTNVKVDPYGSNNVVFTLAQTMTAPGTYEFTIPVGGLKGTKGDVTADNTQSISVSYTVSGPVAYEYVTALSSPTKPNSDGEISANKSLSSMFFSTDTPYLYCADGTEHNVTIKEVNGDFQASARLRMANGLYMTTTSYFVADFNAEPTYNGEYVITIEQGAYGNSIWFDNNEYGRSNAAAEIRFTLVDGRDRDIFTIEAESVTPVSGTYQKAEDLATVTVTFPNGDTKLVNGAYATLGGLDSDYLQQATFTATATPGVYTATFTTLPTSNGKYRLSVAAGSFGNEAFISSNGTSGAGSKAIQEDYDLSLNNGIAGIAADAAEYGVYSVTGVYMGTEVENLPAGIYVINGKKIIVK